MKTLSYLFLLIIVGFFIYADYNHRHPPYGHVLEMRRLEGVDHTLHQTKTVTGFQGYIRGSFFLGSGEIDGRIKSGNHIAFSWSPEKGEVIITEFPASIFTVHISNDQEVPAVRFIFNSDWMKERSPSSWQDTYHTNTLLETSRLEEIRVYISEKDLRKEPTLPQL